MIDKLHFLPLRAAVLAILRAPERQCWTVQGLGMLRCYPFSSVGDAKNEWRLNVWDNAFRRVPPASDMHDHPWHLTSWVVSGALLNRRFIEVDEDMPGKLYNWREIQCGPGAAQCPDIRNGTVRLGSLRLETYRTGDIYSQTASEIHSTDFLDGTVTLNHRERVNGDAAKVFYPVGERWVDAEPRQATPVEVRFGCEAALAEWSHGLRTPPFRVTWPRLHDKDHRSPRVENVKN